MINALRQPALLMGVLLTFALSAQAQVTRSNATGGSIINSTTSQTVTFLVGDFGGCTSLTDVNVVMHWSMPGSGGFTFHDDIAIRLQSPAGTTVDLVQDRHGTFTGNGAQTVTYTGFNVVGATIQTTFDDAAATSAVGSGDPAAGSFQPANPLSAFNTENPAGTWTLFLGDGRDNGFSDVLNWAQFDVVITCGAGLPVELLSFNAKAAGQHVDLDWITGSEVDNKGFYIERSVDGATWDEIGYVSGMGTRSTATSYEWTDLAPFAGLNYYRLRQEDLNGDFEYVPMRSAIVKGIGVNVAVYPNPNQGRFTVQVGEEVELITGRVEVINSIGETVFENTIVSHRSQFSLQGLVPGIYVLRCIIGNDVQTTPLIIR